ncbi:MAG: hypothetical protein ACR2KU_08700 [Gammaproteobacteria bacterium]
MTKSIISATAALALLIGIAGCEPEGSAEQAGENVDEAMDNAGDAMENAKEKTQDATERAGDKIEESTD